MTSSISVYAGKTALAAIKEKGLSSDLIQVMAGASGGPKWFTLFGLDKYIFGEFFKDRTKPIHTIGSSAGAWRMACFAQKDPIAAITRLANYYSNEQYSEKPTVDEISDKALVLLDNFLGDSGAKEIIENPIIQSHFIVARTKGLAKSENKKLQMAGLIAAASINAISKNWLHLFFERFVFYRPNNRAGINDSYFDYDVQNTQYAILNEKNVAQVLLASGAIPMVLRGIKNIDGVSNGVYRDGGIIDYHLDIDFGKKDLVLYPHFFPVIKPGWFDKGLSYRHANPNNFDNVVMITPSVEHIASLPYGKISDRNDFANLDTNTRIKYWQTVLSESERMAEDFSKLVEYNKGIDQIMPIEPIL